MTTVLRVGRMIVTELAEGWQIGTSRHNRDLRWVPKNQWMLGLRTRAQGLKVRVTEIFIEDDDLTGLLKPTLFVRLWQKASTASGRGKLIRMRLKSVLINYAVPPYTVSPDDASPPEVSSNRDSQLEKSLERLERKIGGTWYVTKDIVVQVDRLTKLVEETASGVAWIGSLSY